MANSLQLELIHQVAAALKKHAIQNVSADNDNNSGEVIFFWRNQYWRIKADDIISIDVEEHKKIENKIAKAIEELQFYLNGFTDTKDECPQCGDRNIGPIQGEDKWFCQSCDYEWYPESAPVQVRNALRILKDG